MISFPPTEIDQPRRPRRGAADRVNQRKILLQQIVADDRADIGVVLRGHGARGVLKLRGTHVVRRRVDQVAHQRDRLDHALQIFTIDALWRIELDVAAFRLVVAREAIAAERKRQGGEPRVMWIVGEAVGSARQQLRQLSRQKQVLGVVGVFEPEQDAAQAAFPRQGQIAAGLGLETGGIGEGAGAGGKPLAHLVVIRRRDEPDRDRG